ncbi:hypothetical protein V2J09_023654 [Rumex salicifolius]
MVIVYLLLLTFYILCVVDICEPKNLTELYIEYNNFNGNIPNCIEKLTSIGLLDLSSNNFFGEVPTQLFNRWTVVIFGSQPIQWNHPKFSLKKLQLIRPKLIQQ